MDCLSTIAQKGERWGPDDDHIAQRFDSWLARTGDYEKAEAFFKDFGTTTVDRRSFFVTTGGRLCIIDNRDVQAGDVLAVAAGSSTPLLLRRVPDVGSNTYQLVGGCYCDGTLQYV